MSAYEKATTEIPKLRHAITAMRAIRGLEADGKRNDSCDKYGIRFTMSVQEIWKGYYGRSLCTKLTSDTAADFFCAAAKSLTSTISLEAEKKLQKEIEKLAKAAEEEAKGILSYAKEEVEG